MDIEKYSKEKVEAAVENTLEYEYVEIKVTQRYVDALREEAKRQKKEEEKKIVLQSIPASVFIQEEWELPDGFEVFDEEDE